MLQEFFSFWKNIFNFQGRTRRRDYWISYLYNMSIAFVLIGIVYASFMSCIGLDGEFKIKVFPLVIGVILSIITVILSIAMFIGQIAIGIRRCHDVGLSGWVYLLCCLGCLCGGLGGIAWIVICCMDSKDDNQYGSNPKIPYTYKNPANIVLALVIFAVSLIFYVVVIAVSCVNMTNSIIRSSNSNKGIIEDYEPVVDDSDISSDLDEEDYDLTSKKSEDSDSSNESNDLYEKYESVNNDSDKKNDTLPDNTRTTQTNNFSGNSWDAFEVSIEGNLISLPCTYKDIETLGYKLDSKDGSLDESLDANSYTTSVYVKNDGGKEFSVRFINNSEESKPLKDCEIYGVGFDSFYSVPDVEICGGYTLGMSMEEAKELAGEADYEYSSDDSSYQSLEYYQDDKSYYGGLELQFTNGKVKGISLEDMKN